jgi:drug/metabolite transporter (DMT)-like permease
MTNLLISSILSKAFAMTPPDSFAMKSRSRKPEIGEKIETASRNVGYLAVGALVAYAGVIFLLAAMSFILRAMFLARDVSEPVANLLSFLIVGVIVAGVGASLVMKAINTLKKETPIPTKTVQTLEEDKEWVQRKAS